MENRSGCIITLRKDSGYRIKQEAPHYFEISKFGTPICWAYNIKDARYVVGCAILEDALATEEVYNG